MSEKAISAEVFKLVVVVSSNSLEAGFLPNASSIRDLTIALTRLDALRSHGIVRHQQQSALGNAVRKANQEDGGRFHVDALRFHQEEFLTETHVMFPHAAIGGVDGAGELITVVLDDGRTHRALQSKAW